MDEKGKKLQYEKPELIDIRKRGAAGRDGCEDGSSAEACEVGTSATWACNVGTDGVAFE